MQRVDIATVAKVEKALEVALIVIQNGGSTARAERTFRNILAAYDQAETSVVWRLEFVIACGTEEDRQWTVLRTVGPIGLNLVRASAALALGERAARREVDVAQLDSEAASIRALPLPYGRWTLVAAAAGAAACFSQIPGGDWGAAGIAAVAASVGQLLRSHLLARKMAVGNVTLACGVLSACLAAYGVRLGFSKAAPAAEIAAIVYMVPGLALLNGFVDVISPRHLMIGLERIANAAFTFLLLSIAVGIAQMLLPRL